MPRAQSMDVINDSTTMTSRIDTMLLGVREDWDTSPEIKWNPGDPLYDHPSDTAYVYDEGNPEWNAAVSGGTQCTRQMIELFDDGDRYGYMRCDDCMVDWSGSEAACWCCGQVRESYRQETMPSIHDYLSRMHADPVSRGIMYPTARHRVERRDEFTTRATDPWLRFGYMSPMTVYRQQRVGVVDSVEETDTGLLIRGTMDNQLSPVVAWIQREMHLMLSLEVQNGSYPMLQMLWGDGSGGIERYDPPAEDVNCWYRANRPETLDGIRANRVVMDEWLPITEPVVTNGIVIPDEIPTAKPIAPPVIKSKTFATNADRQNLEELSQEPLTIGSIPVTSSRRNYNA